MAPNVSLYEGSRFVRVGRGEQNARVCIAERAAGAGAAPSETGRRVLLIHGNPSHLDHWGPTVARLPPHASVVAYDQPGLGRSDDFADGRQSLERSVDIAIDVLDHVGWSEPVDVIGQSHGGLVALALAACFPERARSVVLLGTGGTPEHAMYRFFLMPGLDALLLHLAKVLFREPRRDAPPGAPSTKGSALHHEVLATAVRIAARSSFAPDRVPDAVVEEGLHAPATMLQTMVRLAHDRPCRKVAAYAPRVRCPVLFIHGRDDALVPIAHVRRLHRLMEQAGCTVRFVEVTGGHMVHFSRPELVAPVLHELYAAPLARA